LYIVKLINNLIHTTMRKNLSIVIFDSQNVTIVLKQNTFYRIDKNSNEKKIVMQSINTATKKIIK